MFAHGRSVRKKIPAVAKTPLWLKWRKFSRFSGPLSQNNLSVQRELQGLRKIANNVAYLLCKAKYTLRLKDKQSNFAFFCQLNRSRKIYIEDSLAENYETKPLIIT